MAYTPLVTTTPVITQTRQAIVDSSRTNIIALRDAIQFGRVAGATLSVSGGTAEEPSIRLFSSGTDRFRGTHTYSAGYITQIVWEYSANSGGLYDVVATETVTYDGSKNQTAGNNSSALSWLWEWMGKLKDLRVLHLAHVASSVQHGMGSIATQSAANVAITGGFIDAVNIGSVSPHLGRFKQAREVHASASFSAGATLDWAAAGSYDVTATGTGAATLAFSNSPSSGTAAYVLLDLTNGGLRTWTWPTGTKWAGAVAPTLTASGRDLLQFYTRDGGTTIHGFLSSKDSR